MTEIVNPKDSSIVYWDIDIPFIEEALLKRMSFSFKDDSSSTEIRCYELSCCNGFSVWISLSQEDNRNILYLHVFADGEKRSSFDRITKVENMRIIFEYPDLWSLDSRDWVAPVKMKINAKGNELLRI